MTLRHLLTASAAAGLLIGAAQADELQAAADAVNADLAASGADYRVEYAEWIYNDSPDEVTTRFFNDRGNKQLSAQFVPGDARRLWSGPDPNTINWTDDNQDTGDVSAAAQAGAIASAMGTWESQRCSQPGLNGGAIPANTGIFTPLNGPGGGVSADLMHSGFRPGAAFLAFFGSPNVLGVHFTFVFVQPHPTLPPPATVPTDVNNDGFFDKAFGDIYYNDGFAWTTTGAAGAVDIETVVLHESGHGLSQAHFGTAFLDNGSGKLHFAPRAVMNAAYSGVQRDLKGTDRGGHCSLWANWPN